MRGSAEPSRTRLYAKSDPECSALAPTFGFICSFEERTGTITESQTTGGVVLCCTALSDHLEKTMTTLILSSRAPRKRGPTSRPLHHISLSVAPAPRRKGETDLTVRLMSLV